MTSYPIVAEVSVLGLESFGQLDKTVNSLNESTKKFGKTWGDANKAMATVAKRLSKATDGFDRLRQQVDETVDPLRLFGKVGIDVANAIDDISDPALRLTTAMRLLDAQLKRQRGTLNKLGDRFKVVRAEAILFVGSEQRLMAITRAATTAFAAFGAGITALVGGAFAAGIRANKRYTKGVKDLKHNLTVTLATFGQIALQVLRFEEVIGTANKALNKFNKDTAKNADVIGKKMKTLFSVVLTGIRAIGNAFLGIKLIFQGVGVAIGTMLASIPKQIEFMLTLVHVILAKMAKAIKDMLIEIGVPENLIPMKNIEKRLEGITRKLRGIGPSGAKAREMLGAGFKEGAKDIATFNNAIDTMQQKLGSASGGALDFGGLGGGDGKKDDFNPKQKTIGLAGLAQFATLREAMRGAAKGAMDVDFARTVGKSDINRDMEKLIKTARQAAASLGTVARSQRELAQTFGISIPDVVRYVQMMTDLKDQMGSTFKDSLVETTGALSSFFGAFAAGESSLSAFGDAMADLAGNIANTFGQLFVKMGVGMVLVNPAVGAGLIAAGVGLNMLGGAISSKGSANSGGGGGRGSRASATATVNRELARSLRAPERRGGRNETLVLQIGEEQIAATVRRVVNGQMRLNRIGRRSL